MQIKKLRPLWFGISGNVGFPCENIDEIQDLTVALTEMSPKSLNFWLIKFIGEVVNKSGGRYPPRSLHLIVCGLSRYLREVNAEKGFNPLFKGDER